jgi:hypothetical protein
MVLKTGHFEIRSEIPEKFCGVVLKKVGKDQLNDRVRNEQVLHRVKGERNVLHTVKGWKSSWIGHIWRSNCFLKHVIEGKIQLTAR